MVMLGIDRIVWKVCLWSITVMCLLHFTAESVTWTLQSERSGNAVAVAFLDIMGIYPITYGKKLSSFSFQMD